MNRGHLLSRLVLAAALAALLGACGQRGDLYLPSEEREAVPGTKEETTAAEQVAEDQDEAATSSER